MKEVPVVLFAKYNFHLSCLNPIAKELESLEIPFLLETRRHLIYDQFNETKKKFKIFVIADEWGSLFRDCSEILMTTGHSLASKNTTLNSRNRDIDFVCVPSQFYKTELLKRNVLPRKEILVTGYPASDRIFQKKLTPDSFWEKRLEQEKEGGIQGKDSFVNVLIAPTYNKDLSIMEDLIKAQTERSFFHFLIMNQHKSYQIVFKLHPVLPKKYPEHLSFVKNLCDQFPTNIFLSEDSHEDITDAILWADLMIGDSSGALFLGAAGGLPIIAYDNPNRFNSEYFDSSGPEWILRDRFSYRINSVREINEKRMIEKISKEDFLLESRNQVVNLLFENQKSSAKIIANKIKSLL